MIGNEFPIKNCIAELILQSQRDWDSRRGSKSRRNQVGDRFKKGLVGAMESAGGITVDIEFAEDFFGAANRYDNLGAGL